ncbi:MexE family multidrug efflux RND transporter periplasmic adaptor subunit [Marinobacterium nitratireducens]|uniref:MexE family multidrug efflux RND transporter periplasmic adaptor subunit n=1 Tax=Marinobacterium nitratireducens TaxID=518897 RepID=A0A917ZNP3_9GAMM|nr:efflux RND transporter periplasmic adaptor subunit [Marinobacterium nitratireducens]GGO88084.1 MexE family multidrug efflux RND transporter periplasmic adaptor subunit [Marinobacterium nitratireducens]
MPRIPLISLPALLALLTLSGCEQEAAPPAAPPPAAPPPSVTVTAVSSEQIRPYREFVGRSRAIEDVALRAQVSGPLIAKRFTEGDEVEAGTVLFEIDPAPYQTEVAQQEAALQQAAASRDVARTNWERGRQLVSKGNISQRDMDELNARRLETEALYAQTQSALAAAQLRLSYTRVKAPLTGRISQSEVSIGDQITTQTLLASLVQLDPIQVLIETSEQDVASARQMIARGDPSMPPLDQLVVHLRLPNGELFDQQGGIDYIANRVDTATGTVDLRATFPNPDRLVLPGMYVTLIIEAPQDETKLLVPQAAVQEDQQGRFVMLVDSDSKVQRRPVVLGERYGVKWEVVEGLEPGERIVVEGLQKIRAGAEVQTSEASVKPFESGVEN